MKTVLQLFLFFFLSTVLFAMKIPGKKEEPPKAPKEVLASDWWQRNRDDTTTTEMDDSSNQQRGVDVRIPEKQTLPIALPVDKSNLLLERAVEAVEAQKAEAVAIDSVKIILEYLEKNNLLRKTKEELIEPVNAFLDSRFEALLELDESEKADFKSQQATRMANVLQKRREEAFFAGSLVRRDTLTLLDQALDNVTSKLKDARKKNYTPLMEALQEIANPKELSGKGDEEQVLIREVQEEKSSPFFRPISPPAEETPSLKKPTITDAKSVLEQNRLDFEQLASNDSFQEEARNLQEVIRKKYAEFLLKESISNKAAEAKAKENKEFFDQKIKEFAEIKQGGTSEFLSEDHPTMKNLEEIIQELRTRRDAYQQLATTYQEMPHEERASLLQLLKSEQASSPSTSSDKRILLGNHGRMRVEEAPPKLEDVDQQNARDGIMLASLEILERFGPYALHRFNNFFHTEMRDQEMGNKAPLAVEKLKEFVKSEEERELTRTSGFKSLFLTKDSKGIEILNTIYQRALPLSYKGSEQEKIDKKALICLDGSQVDFNPFAVNKFSKKYLVEESKMAHGGVLAIEEALRNGEIEFAKNMTALKRHDVANHFFKQFNDTGKYKNALTASALASFFKVESEKQKQWSDRLYYGCFSKLYDKLPEQYQINRQEWSIFNAIISAVKGQPCATHFGSEIGLKAWNSDISMALSVGITWGTTWINDRTRSYRKPPEVNKENIEEGSSRRNYDLREAADEFSDNRVLMGLHYLLNRGDVKPAFEKRRKFVREWLDRRPNIREVEITNPDERKVDEAFPKLGADIEGSITAAHQKIESQGKEISHSHYFSPEEAGALQASFKKRQAEFLSLEARLPQGLQGMEEIWHSLKTSSDFFSEQAAEINAKVEGGEEAQKNVADLEKLAQHLTTIQEAYDQLADAYLLKYQLQKREQEKLKNQKEKIVVQRPLFFEEIEKLLQADPSSEVDTDDSVNLSIRHATTAEAQEKTLALIQVFIENGYGLDAVRQFNESFSLRAAKEFIKLQELRDFMAQEKNALQQKGINARSIYLPLHYSEYDLYHAPDAEDDKVIRSNGRNLFYNFFLSKELPKDYLIDDQSTAEEGAKHALELLVKMDFFEKVNSVNQQEILWSYEKQFQGEGRKPLTIGAFKKFVEEETNKSQQWSSSLYYTVRDPLNIGLIWSTAMSLLSGYRFQPDFQALQWESKFGVTYATDILTEGYGNFREQKTYKDHIAEMIKQMTTAREEALPIDDAYFQLQQIESDLKNASDTKNYIAWRVAVDKYADKKDEIKALKEAINSFSVEHAFASLEGAQDSIIQLSNNFNGSPIFSKKDLERIQKSVVDFKEKFLLQQARSAHDEGEVEMTQFMAANNALLFQKQAREIEAKSTAAKREMELLQRNDDQALSSNRAALDTLATHLTQLQEGYNELANAYASMLLPGRFKDKEEAGDQGQQSFHFNPNEREFLNEGKDDDVISSTWDAKLVMKAKPKGVLSEKEKEAYRRGISLLELSLQHCYDDEVIRQFQRRFQMKREEGNPLQRQELRDFLASLKEQGIEESFYLAPGHSLEQLLNASYKNAGGIIKVRGLKSVESIDEVKEGRTKALSELEKTTWYQGLTERQRSDISEAYKERYLKSKVVLIPWKKWIGLRDPELAEPLTVDALLTFVDEQKQINRNWWLYYKILDAPAAAVATWNLVTGAAVLARINNDVVRCHSTIPLTTHFFGLAVPQYVLHVPFLALLPTPLHLLPSLAIAYASNYGGEQFNKERQLPLTGISRQANLYRLKQAQLRERYESGAISMK